MVVSDSSHSSVPDNRERRQAETVVKPSPAPYCPRCGVSKLWWYMDDWGTYWDCPICGYNECITVDSGHETEEVNPYVLGSLPDKGKGINKGGTI